MWGHSAAIGNLDFVHPAWLFVPWLMYIFLLKRSFNDFFYGSSVSGVQQSDPAVYMQFVVI